MTNIELCVLQEKEWKSEREREREREGARRVRGKETVFHMFYD